jgi:hypothetical protein
MVRSSVDWSAGDRWRVLPRVDLAGVPREAERPLTAMTLALVAACYGSAALIHDHWKLSLASNPLHCGQRLPPNHNEWRVPMHSGRTPTGATSDSFRQQRSFTLKTWPSAPSLLLMLARRGRIGDRHQTRSPCRALTDLSRGRRDGGLASLGGSSSRMTAGKATRLTTRNHLGIGRSLESNLRQVSLSAARGFTNCGTDVNNYGNLHRGQTP